MDIYCTASQLAQKHEKYDEPSLVLTRHVCVTVEIKFSLRFTRPYRWCIGTPDVTVKSDWVAEMPKLNAEAVCRCAA
jgi:hypothetical protein